MSTTFTYPLATHIREKVNTIYIATRFVSLFEISTSIYFLNLEKETQKLPIISKIKIVSTLSNRSFMLSMLLWLCYFT